MVKDSSFESKIENIKVIKNWSSYYNIRQKKYLYEGKSEEEKERRKKEEKETRRRNKKKWEEKKMKKKK